MRPPQHEKTNTALYLFCAERQEHHKPLFGLSINNVMQPDFAHNLQCLATVMYFALDDSIFCATVSRGIFLTCLQKGDFS